MGRALSVHIGVNASSVAQRLGVSPLVSAENDARAMRTVAEGAGLTPRAPLLGSQATVAAAGTAIIDAARATGSDGFLVITFAGHGVAAKAEGTEGQEDGDEPVDEALVLADGLLCDDCLNRYLSEVHPSTRVVLVLDCCYARGMPRIVKEEQTFRTRSLTAASGNDPSLKVLVADACAPCTTDAEVGASILLLAACEETKQAGEDDVQGLFTKALLRSLEGDPAGYAALGDAVRQTLVDWGMPKPVFDFYGQRWDDSFWNSVPFTPVRG